MVVEHLTEEQGTEGLFLATNDSFASVQPWVRQWEERERTLKGVLQDK